MKNRRDYTEDFKANAVKQFLELKTAGKKIPEIEKIIGVHNSQLYTWTAAAKQESKQIKPGAPASPQLSLPAVATKAPEKNAGGRFPTEVRDRALKMLADGMTRSEVAAQMKVGVATVAYWTMAEKKKSGELIPAPKADKALNGLGKGGEMTDALIFLRQAEKEIMDMVRDGKINRPDPAHLLTLLALSTLQKSINK